jgi:cytochrome P450
MRRRTYQPLVASAGRRVVISRGRPPASIRAPHFLYRPENHHLRQREKVSRPVTDSALSVQTEEAFVFNPFAAGFSDDPYPHYARLRETAPAHEHPLGFWILSRYEDVSRLYRSGQSVDERHLAQVPLYKDAADARRKEYRPMRGMSMLDLDPPDHTRIRRLFVRAFSRRAINAVEPRIETLVDEALDRIAEAGRADLVAEFAFPFPFAVISEMLGTPAVEHARIRELTESLVRAIEPLPDPEIQEEIRAANEELTAIIREIVNWKRAEPADDLISALIAVEHDGETLAEDEMISQIMLLYLAGHETTVNLISNGTLALLRNPDQLRLLQEDPGLVANAVDEFLRYDCPAHLGKRITLEPFVAQGEKIPAGSFVITCLAAANRDPEFWGADAEDLRVHRPNANQNVSFGGGIHHCIGAALARLEARVAFDRFVRRFASPTVERVRWNGRINLRGPAELVVSVR